jgi:WD40 repeat protein
MRYRQFVVVQLAVLLLLPCASYGQSKSVFTEPGSTLLFDGPDRYVTVGKQKLAVQDPLSSIRRGSGLPALALGGDQVAWGFLLFDHSAYMNHKSVLGVYSILDKSWKMFGKFCGGSVGSATFSPDGTRVAFMAIPTSGDLYWNSQPCVLQILDLATGKLTTIPYPGNVWMNSSLSWSPDGKYLAGQIGGWTYPTQQIVVIDVESGRGTIIAEGMDPSWSPKGDWIAYTDKTRQKCLLIHPDGTGAKVTHVLHPLFYYHEFRFGVVWSPDEKRFLFNDAHGILESIIDVKMLDLETGKVTTKSRNGPAIFGWAHNPKE